jgi:hypothetical protein
VADPGSRGTHKQVSEIRALRFAFDVQNLARLASTIGGKFVNGLRPALVVRTSLTIDGHREDSPAGRDDSPCNVPPAESTNSAFASENNFLCLPVSGSKAKMSVLYSAMETRTSRLVAGYITD